ncbi:MAG: hypothetical protein U0270_03180 [Labilithrix sp.]
MKRLYLPLAAMAFVASACSLLTSFSGLSGGAPPDDASVDGAVAPGADGSREDAGEGGSVGRILIDPDAPFVGEALGNGSPIDVVVTTSGPDRLLVAVVAWGSANNAHGPLTIEGGGLTWTPAAGQTLSAGNKADHAVVELWTAVAAAPLSGVTIKATATNGLVAGGSAAFAVWPVTGYRVGRPVGRTSVSENSSDRLETGPVGTTVTQTTVGSLVLGGACKIDPSGAFTERADNTLIKAAWDNSTSVRCNVWRLSGLSLGGDVTIGAVSPLSTNWVATAVEIVPQ